MDNAGNQTQENISFTIDVTPPIISITNPSNGSTISLGQPIITVFYNDNLSDIDISSVKFRFDGMDITTNIIIGPNSLEFTPAIVLADGQHTFDIEVRDLGGNITSNSFTFNIKIQPIIGTIPNQTVDVGNTLSFTVTAFDSNNDNVSIIAKPLPLPDNATFNCKTGLFTFTPEVSQAGMVFDIIFIDSDGVLSSSQSVTVTVNNISVNGITSLQGQILDANDAQNGVITPIVGAIVKNIETGLFTITDNSGNFNLIGLNPDENHFDYDGSAVTAQDGSTYGVYRGKRNIIENVTNIINRPIYLMRIDRAGEIQVDPGNITVLTNPNLDITLTMLPSTVKDENGNDYSGLISISEVPAGFTPASLPASLNPGLIISIQPKGLTFSLPATITFPNFDNLTPGGQVNLWSLNHSTGEFFIAGIGQVSADGSVINTISGGVREASWHFPLTDSLNNSKDNGRNETSDNTKDACRKETDSGFVIQTGNFYEDYTLPSYRSLGISRELKFIYNSTSAYPSPIITTQTSLDPNNVVPASISTSIRIGGVNFGNETFKQGTADLVRQSSIFDATNIETGAYQYFLDTKSLYSVSTVTGGNVGDVIVNNQINSPFGAGWTLDGVQMLHDLNRPDGKVLLTEGDGSSNLFSTKFVGTGGFLDSTEFPVGFFPNSIVTGDFNGDDNLDIAAANLYGDSVSVLLNDGFGSLLPKQDFPVGKEPYSITVGDFNGDGKLDIATANENQFNGTVSILLGNGNGGFSLPVDFPVGDEPHSIIAGDFNGDGKLDLATANENFFSVNDTVSILLGDGTGSFLPTTDFPVGNEPETITTGDFNGDNVLDLATVNCGSFSVSILIGDGDGNFSRLTDIVILGSPFAITAGDFNNDNILDLVVTNSSIDGISILIGDGTGNFSPSNIFDVAPKSALILSANFNSDNSLDLAIVNIINSTIMVLYGIGTGNFSSPTEFPTGEAPYQIATGDFNGDNILDLATGNLRNDTVSILLGESTSSGSTPGDFSTVVRNEDNSFTRTMKDGTQINFDTNGFHTSTSDLNGNTTTYTYDLNGFLTSITDPTGLITTLSYQNGLLSSLTDPIGRITIFQHDDNGNLIDIVNPNGVAIGYTYDPRHLMTSETDPNGNTHTINYSFAGRFESMGFADGSIQQLSASIQKGLVDISSGIGDSKSNPAPNLSVADIESTLINGNGNVTTIKTDQYGAITESSDNCCFGRITTIVRNEDGLATSITKVNGAVTTMTYDENGNLLTSTDQSINATTTFTYDPAFNKVISITDPNGNTTMVNYDTKGNPIEIVDAFGNTTTRTYNTQGQLTAIIDALDNTTIFTYDINGNISIATDSLGNITNFTTDAVGNITMTTDANGNISQFSYDMLNRLISVTDANNNTTNYNYDANGNLTQVIDANSNLTEFEYDSMDRVVVNTDPLGNSDTFTYDGNENLISTTNRNNQIIDFEYDTLNQLIKKSLPNNIDTIYNYDSVGKLTSISAPDSNLTFTYDNSDRLTTVSTAGSPNQPVIAINYTYDASGNRLTMTDSLTGTTYYTYDNLYRISSITNPSNQQVNFSYDAVSRRINTTLPNGVTTNYTYDPNSRLTELQHNLGLATLSNFSYTYDNVGNRTTMNTIRPNLTVNNTLNYTYDSIYQLTQATNPLPTIPDESFNYDPLGNRLNQTGQTIDSIIGTSNQLLEDDKFTYTYDNNGNLVQKIDKLSNETTSYTFNVENQLVQINLANGSIAQYSYDGLGRRIEKKFDGTITRYVYDSEDILFEFDGSNIQVARYTHGFGIDEPLIMLRDSQNFFYHVDGLGSIIDITDLNGNIVQSYLYDSFGYITQQTSTLINPYMYTGREFDNEIGLYYYRARYYDSEIGRFLNEDPIGFAGRDFNLFRYVENNPINFFDPYGYQVGFPDVVISKGLIITGVVFTSTGQLYIGIPLILLGAYFEIATPISSCAIQSPLEEVLKEILKKRENTINELIDDIDGKKFEKKN